MTPEREKYLAKCSKRELFLRKKIKNIKEYIKDRKNAVNKGDYLSKILKLTDDDHFYGLRYDKIELSAYRHELARLKGMDRVVVPREVQIRLKIVGMGMVNVAVGTCKCGERLESLGHAYCPTCGHKVLWEKVKLDE